MSTRSTRRAKRAAQNANQNPQNAPQSTAPLDAPASTSSESGALLSNADVREASAQNQNVAARPTQTQARQTSPATRRSNARPMSASRTNVPKTNARSAPAVFTATRAEETKNDAAIKNDLSPRAWRLLAGTILLVAAALRFWQLDFVPFHHDEGVNGVFLDTLFHKGTYQYNPTNFHGPTLYYFALFTSYLNTFFLGKPGFNEIALRMIPAFFGMGVLALVLSLRRHLGSWATLCATALLAISPGMVYISRYFIHEMQFVFFTLLAVVAMLRFRPRGAWWWPALLSVFVAGIFSSHALGDWVQSRQIDSLTITKFQFLLMSLGFCVAVTLARPLGNRSGVFVAAVSLALLFGSKETAPISVIVLLFSGALTWLLCEKGQLRKAALSSTRNADENESRALFWLDWRLVAVALGAVSLFWIVIAFFFSSFSRDYYHEGMANFFSAYDVWRKTGESDFQAKPLLTYLVWMLTIEPTIFVLGLVGIVLSLWQRSNRFAVFVALWACGIFLAYSLIPYKTPWLMINFVLPFALMSGVALQQCGAWLSRFSGARDLNSRDSSTRYVTQKTWLTAAVLSPFLLLSIAQMRDLNFINYDNDDAMRNSKGDVIQLPKWTMKRNGQDVDMLPGDIKRYPYIYVHTQRGYLDLMRKIDEYAARSGLGYKMPIAVTSDEYWPMPWSLRNYGVGYFGKIINPTNEVLIISRTDPNPQYDQDAQLQPLISDRYVRVGDYPLRPSVTFTLWVRRDLAGS